MRPRTAAAAGCLLFLLAALVLPAGAAPAARAPLTNEDVVRLVMTGTAVADVLRAIAAGPVDFDLSPGMIVELREAGVGTTILEAMSRRQAAMPRREPVPTPTPAPERMGTLRVEFASGDGSGSPASRTAIALKTLPRGMSRRGGTEVGLMTDMAMAVLCISSDHVPDHWDSRSPLQAAPRHELLLFMPRSATDKVKGHEVLYLDHEPAYEVAVPEGSHNIVVGAAGRQAGSGTWRLLESDGARVNIVAGRVTRLVVDARSEIKGSAMLGFAVDSTWKVASVETLDAIPAVPAPDVPPRETRP